MMRTTDGYDPGTMVTKMMMMVNPETSGGYMVGTGATNETFSLGNFLLSPDEGVDSSGRLQGIFNRISQSSTLEFVG
jgi:hypothetical protein